MGLLLKEQVAETRGKASQEVGYSRIQIRLLFYESLNLRLHTLKLIPVMRMLHISPPPNVKRSRRKQNPKQSANGNSQAAPSVAVGPPVYLPATAGTSGKASGERERERERDMDRFIGLLFLRDPTQSPPCETKSRQSQSHLL